MLTVEQILVIQRNLQSYGYLYKQPDGVWDETTQSGYRGWLARYKHVFTSNIPYPLSIQGIPPQLLGYDVEEGYLLAPKPSIDTTQEPDSELPTVDDSNDERGYDVEEETEVEDEVEEDEEEE